MADLRIAIDGAIGHITITRPRALNAITHDIVRAIAAALPVWAADPDVRMVVIDAEGDKAFCAGGDLADIYAAGLKGDYGFAQAFWRDEYRMNAALFEFPKPVASFLHGFTLGGGVGLGCHASHRIVCDNSRIALPEVGVGLVPDVGGSLLLAQAPGRLGEYLGTTARRMGPADAIHAGFADYYIPADDWPALMAELIATGDWARIDAAAGRAPSGDLAALQDQVDAVFAGDTLGDIHRALVAAGPRDAFATDALARFGRHAPLAMAGAVELVHRLRGSPGIRHALELEYRYTSRAPEQGDFLEGIRALIIDKDRTPIWRHAGPAAVPALAVTQMLMPLPPTERLTFPTPEPET